MRKISQASRLSALTAALLATQAQAGTQTQTVTSASLAPASITCSGNTACPSSAQVSSSLSFQQFDARQGVLTGATFVLSMNGSPTLNYDSNKTGSASYLEQTTFLSQTFGQKVTDSNGSATATVSASGYATAPTDLTATQLSSLVGTGTATAAITGNLSATRSGNGPAKGSVSAHTSSGTLTYNYVSHANASFTSGVNQDAASLAAGQLFTISNLRGTDNTAADLSLASIDCTGDCTAFAKATNGYADLLRGFTTLAAGASQSFSTGLLATAVGKYAAQFTLNFTDANVTDGVSSTLRGNSVTLNLSGEVAPVPEPKSAALFAAGLLAIGTLRRRRALR